MLFTSIDFLYLLTITFIVFYLPFMRRWQSEVLLISSMVFYAYNSPQLVLVLLFSLLLNSISAYYLLNAIFWKKEILRVSIFANIILLCFYKYTKLIVSTFLPFYIGSDFVEDIILPIGISFYTFQGISLLLDTYNNSKSESKESPIRSTPYAFFINVSFYISFFPQLIAGPIVKSRDFLPQIKLKKIGEVNYENVVKLLILGFFFKMFVADNLKDITSYLHLGYPVFFSSFSLVLLIYAYAIQIFADFAGYSIIAIGLAQLFGYKLPINFNYPYVSISFFEFWKRWHITLYAWFNQYVYNPFVIAFRDYGKKSVLIGLLIVFSLSGIWHGGSWNFLFWGVFHGMVLIFEFIFKSLFGKVVVKNTFYKLLNILFVFIVVCLGYTIFLFEDLEELIFFYEKLFSNYGIYESHLRFEYYIFFYTLPIVFYHLLYLYGREKINNNIKSVLYGFMLFMIISNSGFEGEFIYFQF